MGKSKSNSRRWQSGSLTKCICRTVRTQTLMSRPDPEKRVPIITSEGDLDSNRRPHEYMLNKSKGRERQRVNRSPSMRTASDGDHHGAVTESRCHTLGSVVCTHGWMPTRDIITTLAAQAHWNVMSCGSVHGANMQEADCCNRACKQN